MDHEPEEISPYQVATLVSGMAKHKTGKEIAEQLGKSGAWVSRLLKTWRNASPDLHKAWATGLNYEAVRKISTLSPVLQARACKIDPRRFLQQQKIPGPEDLQREFLSWDVIEKTREYVRGMLDMCRYVTGEITEEGFDDAWHQHKKRTAKPQ